MEGNDNGAQNVTAPENLTGDVTEMPRYRCHKEVCALKIKAVQVQNHCNEAGIQTMYLIVPEEAGYAPFQVSHAYIVKHNPQAGGYYVVYKDGYESYSPAKAFEEGYAPIEISGAALLRAVQPTVGEVIRYEVLQERDRCIAIARRQEGFMRVIREISAVGACQNIAAEIQCGTEAERDSG